MQTDKTSALAPSQAEVQADVKRAIVKHLDEKRQLLCTLFPVRPPLVPQPVPAPRAD